MTFSEALDVLKSGGMVNRPQEWCGGSHGVAIKLIDDIPGIRPFIAIETGRGDWAPWLPQQFDLLAEDWAEAAGPSPQ